MNGKALLKLKKRPEKTDYAKKGWMWLKYAAINLLLLYVLIFLCNGFSDKLDVSKYFDWVLLLFYLILTALLTLATSYFLIATFKQKIYYFLVSVISAFLIFYAIIGALMAFSR